mmetsp:Transcript_6009/g.8416  ORF Transcript_6009/g.8416 Transcript_6009/m.8416 type:complete len:120 (-) Transcript_6009:135-494(-)
MTNTANWLCFPCLVDQEEHPTTAVGPLAVLPTGPLPPPGPRGLLHREAEGAAGRGVPPEEAANMRAEEDQEVVEAEEEEGVMGPEEAIPTPAEALPATKHHSQDRRWVWWTLAGVLETK